jgi:hypothetical protein
MEGVAMKKIPKKQFDEVIRLTREFWEDADDSNVLLQERIKIAMNIKDVSGVDWFAIINFVDSLFQRTGFLPDASNEMIYILLRVLGWEVVEDVEINIAV